MIRRDMASTDLQRVRGVLRLRASRGGAEEEHQGRVVEGRGAVPR